MADASAGRRLRQLLPWSLALLAYWLTHAGAWVLATGQPRLAALRYAAASVLPEALLLPGVLRLTARLPWGRTPPLRLVAGHLAGALIFAGLAQVGAVLAFTTDYWLSNGVWSMRTDPRILVWRGVMSLLVYATVASAGHATAFARRAREEAARAARAEALRAEAQLAALHAQLNPHFILNLLHSLIGLVARDPGLATAGLERLGDVLRYVVRVQRGGADEVPLAAEWEFVEDYLSLERLRLGERLRTRLDADPEALALPLPAFVLQPLVENAVRHAVAPRTEGGTVVVTARCDGPLLRLRVEDDGPGDAGSASAGEGMGLRLIRERLAALYGGGAQLTTGPSTLGGFAAEVTLPRAGAATAEGA